MCKMQPVMSVADVRDFEASLDEKGLKAPELMRRAGAVVALQAARFVDGGSVVVLCGMGNNGGDGWVAADNLARHGYEVNVVSAATPAVMKTEAARQMAARASEMGVPVHVNPSYEELAELLGAADVVVDAIFGTGFKGVMPSPYDTWVEAVDAEFEGAVVSVDVPSGISAQTGMAEGPYFESDVTVTMFAAKPGLISGMGRTACGQLVVASLASDDEGLSDLSGAAAAFTLTEADYDGVLPEADPLGDKYTHGRVLVVAGSARYPGAAVMAALAAARSGAGYVTLAVPEPVVPAAQAHLLSIPVVGLPADAEGSFAAEAADRVAPLAAKADVVLAGPGMTTSFGACEVVRRLLAEPCALVLDADALNALVKVCCGSAEEHPDALRRERPLVLTPHRRELARLAGKSPAQTASLAGAMHEAQAIAWAVGSSDFCVVAKGSMTCVATIDSTLIPEPGPAALATAGTGDVLAGVVAGVLAQDLVQRDPAGEIGSSDLLMLMAAADRVHALAGFLAAGEHGSRGVVAPDVIDKVGLALDALVERSSEAAERASADEGGELEGGLAFEDESRVAQPPEVARLKDAGGDGAHGLRLPGELEAYEGDLEEPEDAPSRDAASATEEPADAARGDGEGVGAEGEGSPALPLPPFLAAFAGGARGAAEAGPGDEGGDDPDGVGEEAATQEGPGADAGDVPDDACDGDGGDEAQGEEPGEDAPDPAPVPDSGDSGAPEDAGDVSGPATASPVPPFLAHAVAAAEAAGVPRGADEPAAARAPIPAGETTILPPVQEEEPTPEADVEFEDGDPLPKPRSLTPQEMERRRREVFHERATLHIDEDSVTPVDDRPSAKPRRRR